MKTMTSKIKAEIFAQYYGQQLLRWHQWSDNTLNSIVDMKAPMKSGELDIDEGWFLELKPLSNISDDDAIEVSKFLNWGRDIIKNRLNGNIRDDQNLEELKLIYIRIGKKSVEVFNGYKIDAVRSSPLEISKCFQYLLSKGYALPYLDYTVEDLVELGAYKLI